MTDDELSKSTLLNAALCRGAEPDELGTLIDDLYGKAEVKSLGAVAKMFGVAQNTVSGNWRQDGMPGDKRGYPIGEVFKWYARRHFQNMSKMRAGKNPINEAKEAAQLRKLSADADVAVARADCLTGDMVSRNEVSSQYRACLIVLREGIMAIPSKVKPFLPREFASDICARIKNVCRLTLEGLGSKSQAELDDLYQEQLK